MAIPRTLTEIEQRLTSIQEEIEVAEKAGNKFVLCGLIGQLDELLVALAQWLLRQKQDSAVEFRLSSVQTWIQTLRWDTVLAAEKIRPSGINL